MITPLRNAANASPQSTSELGSQPATSVYHCTHWEREGSPGVWADGRKAKFVRTESASLGGLSAKLYGLRRFERSDRGWPIVDISQLDGEISRSEPSHTTESVATGSHLLENTNHPGFRLVIDKVVDLVVTMNQCASILRLGFWISEELHYIFIVRSLAYWGVGLDIDSLGLRRRNGAEGLDLAVVEARGPAKAREVDRGRGNAVKLRKRRDGLLPPVRVEKGRNKYDVAGLHLGPFLSSDTWK